MVDKIDSIIERLKKCELITEEEVLSICTRVRDILIEEGNVQRVYSPLTVENLNYSRPWEMFMGKSSICLKCSGWLALLLKSIISSWETMSIEDSIQSKLCSFY